MWHTVLIVFLFLVGLALIVKGGDVFVDAATWIAETFGIPKFIVGATIVSMATTLPELLVSAFAAAQGSVDMAIGNAIGSVTANIGLIMGISIVCLPSIIRRRDILPKSAMMVGAALLILLFCLGGSFGWVGSILLLLIFALFIFENLREAKRSMLLERAQADGETKERVKPAKKAIVINVVKFILGAAAIVGGAELMVNYGKEIAGLLGIPESIIGVTVIAIGTSLPELVTTITAIIKKQSSLSIGNILGANIIDLALILPVCKIICGGNLPVAKQSFMLDMPACFIVSLVAVLPTIITGKFHRWQGVLLLLVYAVYVVLLCTNVIPVN